MPLEYMHNLPNMNVKEMLGQHTYIYFDERQIMVNTHSSNYKPNTYEAIPIKRSFSNYNIVALLL